MKFQLMSIAVAMAFSLGAQAQSTSTRQVKNADEDRIEAEYKAARERCDSMSGDAKDRCQKEVKDRFGK